MDIPTAPDRNDTLINIVAIAVALIASFMAITKVKDDNIVQAMLQAKADAVDTWNEYQSKRLKHHMMELGKNQAIALRAALGHGSPMKELDEMVDRYDADMARYTQEEKGLTEKARSFEKQYDTLNFRDDQFDLSDAILSVSLATLAVTALTRKRWLLALSLAFAAFGVVMGVAGLAGLQIHPDRLVQLLS